MLLLAVYDARIRRSSRASFWPGSTPSVSTTRSSRSAPRRARDTLSVISFSLRHTDGGASATRRRADRFLTAIGHDLVEKTRSATRIACSTGSRRSTRRFLPREEWPHRRRGAGPIATIAGRGQAIDLGVDGTTGNLVYETEAAKKVIVLGPLSGFLAQAAAAGF